MKASVLATTLADALAVAKRAASARSTLPVLSHVLLDAADGLVTVTGTDLEHRAWKGASARVDEPGAVCLPPDPLAEFLTSLPTSEAVKIEVSDNHKVVLSCGRTIVRLAGLDSEEFPVCPSFDDPAFDLTLAADVFARAVLAVGFAAAKTEGRPTLAGISLVVRDGTLTTTGADGFCLAIKSEDIEADGEIAIIPVGRRLVEAANAVAKSTSARLVVDARLSSLLIESEAGSWVVRLIDGQYPDWRRIIPQPEAVKATVTVAQDALLRATKLTTQLAAEASWMVNVSRVDGALRVQANDTTNDRGGTADLDAEWIGNSDLSVTFNGKYLRDAVDALGDHDQITLELTSPATPAIVRAAGERGNYTLVVMPMHNARGQ